MWIVARIIAAALLFWALAQHPYGYFTLLRWVTCGVAVYSAIAIHRAAGNQSAWVWLFGFVAVLFNPIVPVHLSRSLWAPIDVVTGLLMLASIAKYRTITTTGNSEIRA